MRSEELVYASAHPELITKTMTQVYKVDSKELHFITDSGEHHMFYHDQECWEDVSIEEIHGELSDLVGSPLVMCEEAVTNGPKYEGDNSTTWTFYRFTTVKGHVTVRWVHRWLCAKV